MAEHVERGGIGPDPLHGRGQIGDQLVPAHGEDHVVRPVSEAGHPVAHHVQVDQLPFFGDRIGAGEEQVRQQCLPPTLEDLRPRNPAGKGLDHADGRHGADGVEHPCLGERHGIPPGDHPGVDGQQQPLEDEFARLGRVGDHIGFKVVFCQGCGGAHELRY